MAFYRRTYRSRRRTGIRARPRYYRKSTPTVARKALYLARKANRKELKYSQVTNNDIIFDNTYNDYYVKLSQTTRATDASGGRIGDTIEPTSINIRMNMSMPVSATAQSCTIRIILFQWKSETYTVATDGSILQERGEVTSYKSFQNRYQSNFLLDKTYSLSIDGVRQMQISLKRKLKGIIAYPQTGDWDTPNRNGVYMMVLSSVPDDNVLVEFSSRLYYHDN